MGTTIFLREVCNSCIRHATASKNAYMYGSASCCLISLARVPDLYQNSEGHGEPAGIISDFWTCAATQRSVMRTFPNMAHVCLIAYAPMSS